MYAARYQPPRNAQNTFSPPLFASLFLRSVCRRQKAGNRAGHVELPQHLDRSPAGEGASGEPGSIGISTGERTISRKNPFDIVGKITDRQIRPLDRHRRAIGQEVFPCLRGCERICENRTCRRCHVSVLSDGVGQNL